MSDARDPWDALWDLIDDRLPESDLIKLGDADDFVEAIRKAGWRPPAQVIESRSELDALPIPALVEPIDTPGRVWLRTETSHTRMRYWVLACPDSEGSMGAGGKPLAPARLLWSPPWTAEQ